MDINGYVLNTFKWNFKEGCRWKSLQIMFEDNCFPILTRSKYFDNQKIFASSPEEAL